MDDTPFRKRALAMHGVSEVRHFARRAYRRRVIFASLAPDGRTANLRLPPERQADLAERFPHALASVPNKWGERGWTTLTLRHAEPSEVEYLLKIAFDAAG